MSRKSPILAVTDVDDLTPEQLDERLKEARGHIQAIRELLPGMVRLEETERRGSLGRNLAQLGGPLHALFTLLLPKDGESPAIARVFDVLGDQDDGDDPERFEPALLLRRLHRAEAQNAIVGELDALSRDIADDVLATGESVLAPGLLALNLARSIAKGNPAYRSALRSVLDSFRNLTKRARQSRAEKLSGSTAASPTAAPAGK
jgi:hypothetical protein